MYTDYTLDLETMGVRPTSCIMSIGAAAFNRHEPDFRYEDLSVFRCNVDLQDCMDKGLTIDASTLYWWLTQDNDARSKLDDKEFNLPLEDALHKLSMWILHIGGDELKCWTHATFDAPILANAFHVVNLPLPTHFRMQRDIRTLEDLKGRYEIERQGTHHSAVDDAKFQAHYIWGSLNA